MQTCVICEKARKIENSINKITVEDLDNYIFTEQRILDDGLARVFKITTNKLRIITKTHINTFSKEEIYQLTDNELKLLKEEDSEYVTTINPYLYNISAVIKIATLIDTPIAKEFVDCFIKNAIINELFITKNKILQTLYDTLTDNYCIKTKIDKKKKEKLKLQETIERLNSDICFYKEKYDNMYRNFLVFTMFLLAILCIVWK